MFRSIEDMIVATAESVRPPERLTVSRAAEKYRFLNNPGSYVGKWDNNIAPYLVEPMDELTSLDYTGMIFAGPARCGKSDMFLNWMTHTAICDPADTMIVHMTQATARDWSQGDLAKLFRHSKPVGERLTPGRQNDNVFDKKFLSGTRLLVKWPTITELSGKTIPRLWLMDYDRMTQDVDGEGNPFDLTRKRAQTFKRFGMCVAESSPGFMVDNPKWQKQSPHEAPPTEGILALFNRGDRRLWYWRCVSCHYSFEPSFKLLSYPDSKDHLDAAEQAVMACPHCGQVYHHDFDEKHGTPGKNELNIGGRWLRDGQVWGVDGQVSGVPRRSDIASFWLKGPAAVFASWKDLVLRYLKATEEYELTQSEASLKTTVNVDQGEAYTPKANISDRLPETLKDRAVDRGMKMVPPGVRFLLGAIDVQKNRFIVQVMGVGANGDWWIIDRFEIKKSERLDEDGERLWVNPGAYPEDWKLLVPEVLAKSYPLADGSGREMKIKAVACDSAGSEGVTKNAYAFYRYLRDDPESGDYARRFQLVKGTSTPGAPRVAIAYPDSERKDRHANARGEIPILFLQSDQIKDMAAALLDRVDAGGTLHFPDWLPDSFFTELTVEIRTTKGWSNPKGWRNESWDLLCYGIAMTLSRHVRIEQINWEKPPGWASEWDANDLIFTPENGDKPFEPKAKVNYDLAALAQTLA